MATDERLPLLVEDEPSDFPSYTPKNLVPQSLGPISERSKNNERITISSSSSVITLAEKDTIVAIFVVAFDTRSGKNLKFNHKFPEI